MLFLLYQLCWLIRLELWWDSVRFHRLYIFFFKPFFVQFGIRLILTVSFIILALIDGRAIHVFVHAWPLTFKLQFVSRILFLILTGFFSSAWLRCRQEDRKIYPTSISLSMDFACVCAIETKNTNHFFLFFRLFLLNKSRILKSTYTR